MTKILSIESSADETSIAVTNFSGERNFAVLSHNTASQVELHNLYGGIYPAMARREHQKNIIPLLFKSLEESELLTARPKAAPLDAKIRKKVEVLLDRDAEIAEKIILLAEQYKAPNIAAVAVTYGPGLEIALWTGFNTARALAVIWNCDLIPTNHMEGHLYAALVAPHHTQYTIQNIQYPSLGLLISGGHTELVLMRDEHKYKIIGQTLDDAVGEAYDKSARLLGLPYPGGILISQQAELARQTGGNKGNVDLPRPMLYTKDYNFSFSGLKTAVRTVVQKQTRISKQFRQQLCLELEESIADVLVKKTARAMDQYGIKQLVIGGGVSANTNLRREFTQLCTEKNIDLHLPDRSLSGDNALMINLAGYRRWKQNNYPKRVTRVKGNLKIK